MNNSSTKARLVSFDWIFKWYFSKYWQVRTRRDFLRQSHIRISTCFFNGVANTTSILKFWQSSKFMYSLCIFKNSHPMMPIYMYMHCNVHTYTRIQMVLYICSCAYLKTSWALSIATSMLQLLLYKYFYFWRPENFISLPPRVKCLPVPGVVS